MLAGQYRPGKRRPIRCGSAEDAILAELRRSGGPVPRRLLVDVLLAGTPPSAQRRRPGAAGELAPPAHPARLRQHAESTLSRALRSLERKGLILRTFSGPRRQVLISLTNPPPSPVWEQDAREEEAFAARCAAASAELAELGQRAHLRATQLRTERRPGSALAERGSDAERGAVLMSKHAGHLRTGQWSRRLPENAAR